MVIDLGLLTATFPLGRRENDTSLKRDTELGGLGKVERMSI